MADRDFYEVLGVERTASAEDLKHAYRALAKACHPDRNPGDATAERRFKDINEAYDCLKDPQSRAAYDHFGHAASAAGRPGAGRPGAGAETAFSGSMSDLFNTMFGDIMGGHAHAGRGSDLRHDMSISLEAAYAGARRPITVQGPVVCAACSGTGGRDGARARACATCGGAGAVHSSEGVFTVRQTCPACRGQGQIITDPCRSCRGEGRTHGTRRLALSIPAGVGNGARLRLAGEGEPGMAGADNGDLYIFLTVAPHPLFQRNEADLLCEVPVPMTTAALGGEVDVPLLDGGAAKVKIPAASQTGKRLRLRGKGMPVVHGRRCGDLYVQLAVETPAHLTARQKTLLREFADASGPRTHPQTHRFLDRVRAFFENLHNNISA